MLANDLSRAVPGRLKLSGSIELTDQHLQVLNSSDDFMLAAIVRVRKPALRMNAEGDLVVDWELSAEEFDLILTKELQDEVYEGLDWIPPNRLEFPPHDEEGVA